MTSCSETLLYLLRAGLGKAAEGPAPVFADTPWKELMDKAASHGVLALLADALQALESDGADLGAYNDKEQNVRYELMGEQLGTEIDSREYKAALESLALDIEDAGLGRIMVMKGYGLSLYYPHPGHRSFGDIDIYSLDGNSSAIDKLLSSEVKGKSRHSHAVYKGYSIENHYFFSNMPGDARRDAVVEDALCKEALKAVPHTLGKATVYLPTADFNAIFLIWHIASHLTMENINLRQLSDWVCFLRSGSGDIDWEKVTAVLKQGRKWKLFNVVCSVCVKYLALDPALVPPLECSPVDEARFIDFVMDALPLQTKGLEAAFKYFRRRWNFRIAHQEHWAGALSRAVISHLIN